MKKRFFTVVALAALTVVACTKKEAVETTTANDTVVAEVTAVAFDGDAYTVQTADSKIDWEAGKVSGDKHMGTLSLSEGEAYVKDGKFVGGKFTLDMNTINVTDVTEADKKEMLEGHLKGTGEDAEKADHFFNVSKYPTANFTTTNVTDAGEGKVTVEGQLTVKDKTNPVTFTATVKIDGDTVTLASDNFTIDRTLWGVNYNSGTLVKDLAADKIINDEIQLLVTLVAKKK